MKETSGRLEISNKFHKTKLIQCGATVHHICSSFLSQTLMCNYAMHVVQVVCRKTSLNPPRVFLCPPTALSSSPVVVVPISPVHLAVSNSGSSSSSSRVALAPCCNHNTEDTASRIPSPPTASHRCPRGRQVPL